MNQMTMILAAAALVVIGGGYYLSTQDADATSVVAGAATTQAGAAETAATPSVTEDGYAMGDVILGDPDAPVTIVEYASLTCPHCATFHLETLPTIKADYIDTGKAKLLVREVYFDAFGLWAAALARCGGADKYHAFLDTLFEQQRAWTRVPTQEAVVTELRRIGQLGGLSGERVDACLTDQVFMNTLVETYQTHNARDNIEATPTFLVNGERVRGAVGADQLAAIIDAQLAE